MLLLVSLCCVVAEWFLPANCVWLVRLNSRPPIYDFTCWIILRLHYLLILVPKVLMSASDRRDCPTSIAGYIAWRVVLLREVSCIDVYISLSSSLYTVSRPKNNYRCPSLRLEQLVCCLNSCYKNRFIHPFAYRLALFFWRRHCEYFMYSFVCRRPVRAIYAFLSRIVPIYINI